MTNHTIGLYDTDKQKKERISPDNGSHRTGRKVMEDYTLREMLKSRPFQELQILAGEEGLDAPVRYVGVLEAPDSVDFVKEHEFILTTGYIFSDQEEQLLQIIRQLHERRAAALGIKMFRYLNGLPEIARKLADECRLPIFFVPNKYSWHELIEPMILHIAAANARQGILDEDYEQLLWGMQHRREQQRNHLLGKNPLLQKGLALYKLMMGEPLKEGMDAAGELLEEEREFSPAMLIFKGEGRIEERITVYNPTVLKLLEKLKQKWEICGFTDTEGRLQLFIPVGKGEETGRIRLARSRKISAGVLKTVQGYFPDLEVQMGTGRQGCGLEEIRRRRMELEETMGFLRHQGIKEMSRQFLLHDLGMKLFFANSHIREFLKDFLKEYFEPIEQLEEDVRDRLMEAVRGYVGARFNTREAARELGVHHNTVRNRLEQFLNLTGLDLKNEEDLLLILLYLNLYNV